MPFYPSNLRNRWISWIYRIPFEYSMNFVKKKRPVHNNFLYSFVLMYNLLIKCFFQPRKWDFILSFKFICMGIEIKRFMLGFVYFVNFGAWRKVVARELSFWIFKLRLLIWSILGTWVLVCFPNQHPFDGEVRNFQF